MLIGFTVPIKQVRLIKISLNERYNEVHVGKHLFRTFPTQNNLKQGDAFRPCFSTLFRIHH
jgi:hypothetical protein